MKKLKIVVTILIFFLGACGTQDYGPSAPSATKQDGPPPTNQKPLVEEHDTSNGSLWRGMKWVGIQDSKIADLKSRLADSSHSDSFCAFGAAVLGGSALGLVIRYSDSWFFGAPVKSTASHPFWKKLDESVKMTGQGLAKGAAMGTGCYLLLAGLHPLPFDGFLGQNFRSLSAATVLGTMSGVAAAPLVKKMASRNWREPFEEWTRESEVVKGVRYKVAPGLAILGTALGVGILTYELCDETK